MKILFLIARADTIGGANVHVRDMAQMLMEYGQEVFVCTGFKGLFCQALDNLRIPYYACPTLHRSIHPIKDWQALWDIRSTISRIQPDLISIHSSKTGILGRITSLTLGIPCIFTAHGWAYSEGVPEKERRLYGWLERLFAPLAKKIICVSEYDRSLAISNGISSDRLICIHNGVPDIPFELYAKPGKSDDKERIRLVMVARFDSPKDHTTLLRACSEIHPLHIDFLGDGPNFEYIKDLAYKLGMSGRVKFFGFHSNVAKIMSEAHIFSLISNWEGFPRTTIEAMRAGLPTVVSDVGGAAEAVVEGVTGFMIPRRDVASLRDRLRALVNDPSLRQTMGEAARKRYESEFTFARMYEQTVGVYQQVLQDKKSPRIL